jgi:serine protease Do
VQLLRDGERKSIPVRLEAMPDQYASAPARRTGGNAEPDELKTKSSDSLGIEVAELTAELREQLKLGNDASGVVVTDVAPDGPAASKEISRGDLIERVGTTPVASVEEFEAAVGKAGGRNGILLLLRSGTGTRFVVVQPRK